MSHAKLPIVACVALSYTTASCIVSAEIPVENAILKIAREVAISAESTGRLAEILVREGDRIGKDQLLARIDDRDVQSERQQGKIALKTAEIEHANTSAIRDAELAAKVAENELDRALRVNLRVPDTYRAAEIERYELAVKRSQLQIEQARHERQVKKLEEMAARVRLEGIEEAIRRHRVHAPWDGLVVAVDAAPGKWLEAGTEILTIIDPQRLRIEGFVSSEHAVGELVDAKAIVRVRRPNNGAEQLIGRVIFVSPDVNPVNSQARIFIEVEDPEQKLRPGWKVEASVRPAGMASPESPAPGVDVATPQARNAPPVAPTPTPASEREPDDL